MPDRISTWSASFLGVVILLCPGRLLSRSGWISSAETQGSLGGHPSITTPIPPPVTFSPCTYFKEVAKCITHACYLTIFQFKRQKEKSSKVCRKIYSKRICGNRGNDTLLYRLGRVPCDNDWKNPVRSGRKQRRYSQWLCAVGCLAFFVSVQLRFFEDSWVFLAWLGKDKQKVFC